MNNSYTYELVSNTILKEESHLNIFSMIPFFYKFQNHPQLKNIFFRYSSICSKIIRKSKGLLALQFRIRSLL